MPDVNKAKLGPTPTHHYVRTVFASLFGFFAVALIIVGILVVWLNSTISNTSQYTKTVSPLAADPDVQAFVVSKASSSLLDGKDAPIRDITKELFGESQVAEKTNEQLRALAAPLVQSSLKTVISSPAFATLWEANNKSVHEQLIRQLKSNSPTIQLNFQPLITGTINELVTTKLGFVKDKLEIKDTTGIVTIEGDQLTTFRKSYNNFQKALLAIITLAILFTALCIIISVHHLKTVRRIALMTGIFAGVLAALLSASSLIAVGGNDVLQQKFVAALFNGVTHDLRIGLVVIAIIGIGGAIASKIYDAIDVKKQLAKGKKT